MKMSITALALTVSMNALAAQDPLKDLPGSYSKQFENDWVRVVRVRYEPYARLPAHAHNSLAAAYVYLNDAGPVLFKHIGASYGAATRPATRAGSFRLFRGIDEVHEVENASELASEFLRVEFKTEPKDVRTLKGRFFRPSAPHGQNLEQVQFENAQVRVTRVTCAPGLSLHLSAAAAEPLLLIALQAARLRESSSDFIVSVGQERWIAAGRAVKLENAGSQSSEFLRFDFKTAPLPPSPER